MEYHLCREYFLGGCLLEGDEFIMEIAPKMLKLKNIGSNLTVKLTTWNMKLYMNIEMIFINKS